MVKRYAAVFKTPDGTCEGSLEFIESESGECVRYSDYQKLVDELAEKDDSISEFAARLKDILGPFTGTREILKAEHWLRHFAAGTDTEDMTRTEAAGVAILGELGRLRRLANRAFPGEELHDMLQRDSMFGDELHTFIDLCHKHFKAIYESPGRV